MLIIGAAQGLGLLQSQLTTSSEKSYNLFLVSSITHLECLIDSVLGIFYFLTTKRVF
jgi:hypothetical protein